MDKISAKFLGTGGYDRERKIANELLEVGKLYNLEDLCIGSSYTNIWLEGFENSFNSVMFDFYRNGEEIDIVDEYGGLFGY